MDAADNTTTASPQTVTAVQLTATADSPTPVGVAATLTATLQGDMGYTVAWDFGDGSSPGTGPIVNHSYGAAGTYTATAAATKDASGFSISTTVIVDVVPTAVDPLADLAILSDSPTSLGATTTLTASTTAMLLDGDFTWTLGDGSPAQGRVVTHTYAATGSYTVILTASDLFSTNTVTATVTIIDQADLAWLYLPLVLNGMTQP